MSPWGTHTLGLEGVTRGDTSGKEEQQSDGKIPD